MVIFRSHSAVTTGISVVPPSTDNTTCAKRGSTASHCTKLLTPRISFTDDTIGKVLRIYGTSHRMDSRVYIEVFQHRSRLRLKNWCSYATFAALYHFLSALSISLSLIIPVMHAILSRPDRRLPVFLLNLLQKQMRHDVHILIFS